jgi:hypothetical protein
MQLDKLKTAIATIAAIGLTVAAFVSGLMFTITTDEKSPDVPVVPRPSPIILVEPGATNVIFKEMP